MLALTFNDGENRNETEMFCCYSTEKKNISKSFSKRLKVYRIKGNLKKNVEKFYNHPNTTI
jgi:hypothetical protein